MTYQTRRAVRRGMWGIVFILVGLAFLLDQLRVIHLGAWALDWWRWWPAVVILIGIANMLTPLRPKHISNGLFMVMLGVWFFICQNEWHGFTFRTGWPLVIIGMGISVVFGAAVEHLWRNARKDDAGTPEGPNHA
jgi:Domain of unknown function (DUF5668)